MIISLINLNLLVSINEQSTNTSFLFIISIGLQIREYDYGLLYIFFKLWCEGTLDCERSADEANLSELS